MTIRLIFLPLLLSLIACSDNNTADDHGVQIEHLSGGLASVSSEGLADFSKPSNNMLEKSRLDLFHQGNRFFEEVWHAPGHQMLNQNGLGPLFNNNACQSCHLKDGRGFAPDGLQLGFDTLLFKLSKATLNSEERSAMEAGVTRSIPDPSLGTQLQQTSIVNVLSEVELAVTYVEFSTRFDDSFEVQMRKPIWHFNELSEERIIADDIVFSARVASSMIGLGLLQLIPEQDIYKNQDIDDKNNDGISGRANLVWSDVKQMPVLGRFGWKASSPNLIEQAAAAFHQDMGLTSRFNQSEPCTLVQIDCLNAPTGKNETSQDVDYEVSDNILDAVVFYSHHLAVPQRQNAYADDVQNGKAIFNEIGCANCHVESYVTGTDPQHPELSDQTIFPYTDLLLHDMGSDLADFSRHNGPAPEQALTDFRANTREWRTPPLWGIGRAKQVNPDATFLHDGRARTIMEGVLWHGGEAEAAKQKVLKLNANERDYLLAFLNDL